MNQNNELMQDDIIIDPDFEIEDDTGIIIAYIETWFDVDKKFDTKTADNEDEWVNLYAKYNVSEDILQLEYIIENSDKQECFNYSPTDSESQLIKSMIRAKCIEKNDCTLEELIAQMNDTPELGVTQ